MLMGVGDRLRMVLRDSDVAARLGGDEFAVLLDDIPNVAAGETVAARIIQSLHEPFTIKGRSVTISASVGLSISDSEGLKKPDELVKEADDAMYVAKGLGKGRYKTSGPAPLAVT